MRIILLVLPMTCFLIFFNFCYDKKIEKGRKLFFTIENIFNFKLSIIKIMFTNYFEFILAKASAQKYVQVKRAN